MFKLMLDSNTLIGCKSKERVDSNFNFILRIQVATIQIFLSPDQYWFMPSVLWRTLGDSRTECLHSFSVFSQQTQKEAFWYLWFRTSVMGSWCQQNHSCYPTCAIQANCFPASGWFTYMGKHWNRYIYTYTDRVLSHELTGNAIPAKSQFRMLHRRH